VSEETPERREERYVSERALKLGINEDQLDTLATLERFGWSLKFIRQTPAGPLAVVHDPDHNKLAVIEVDGRLNEEKPPAFRS
jgi:hypothetical protein